MPVPVRALIHTVSALAIGCTGPSATPSKTGGLAVPGSSSVPTGSKEEVSEDRLTRLTQESLLAEAAPFIPGLNTFPEYKRDMALMLYLHAKFDGSKRATDVTKALAVFDQLVENCRQKLVGHFANHIHFAFDAKTGQLKSKKKRGAPQDPFFLFHLTEAFQKVIGIVLDEAFKGPRLSQKAYMKAREALIKQFSGDEINLDELLLRHTKLFYPQARFYKENSFMIDLLLNDTGDCDQFVMLAASILKGFQIPCYPISYTLSPVSGHSQLFFPLPWSKKAFLIYELSAMTPVGNLKAVHSLGYSYSSAKEFYREKSIEKATINPGGWPLETALQLRSSLNTTGRRFSLKSWKVEKLLPCMEAIPHENFYPYEVVFQDLKLPPPLDERE